MFDYCLIIYVELIFELELGWLMVYWVWLRRVLNLKIIFWIVVDCHWWVFALFIGVVSMQLMDFDLKFTWWRWLLHSSWKEKNLN